ncbi:zinc-dependent alcohol dehydrogenase family protein [Streptomyces sp. RFCAC02]|uniref:zinc-dependent alcohol dehydrogenase family protein n=1 Tax=Streptomyces sp. RFCAC02 TaxID=2499143 RepID=UPI00101F67FB|nr:zinc-dependent alcohol dehydrogenase family protein [Streptomyces sp. RFCAC02]
MAMTVRFHEYGDPEVLRIEEVPAPEPGIGEVRIRVDAIGLNRADALFRRGQYGRPVRAFPAGLGYEAAGVVEAAGPGVTTLPVGSPVSTIPAFSMTDYGVYGDTAVVPAAAVVRRPDGVDAVTGAATWMTYLTAFGGLLEGDDLRPGGTVVVTAASSGVGIAALRTARRVGARAIATTRTAAKRDQLLAAGADAVVVTGEEDLAEGVLRATDGRGADVVFDAVGGPEAAALPGALAPSGRIVLYGALGGATVELPALATLRSGLTLRAYSISAGTTTSGDTLRRATAFITSGLADGSFRPVVDRVFDLSEIVAAHRHLESGTQVGKVVVTVRH